MLKWYPSIIFNIALIAIVFKMGEQLGLETQEIFLVCMVWSVFKLLIGEPKHYKAWQLCLIWTNVMFLSIFRLQQIHIAISCLCAIFTGYTLSGKADIKENVTIADISQWKPKQKSKHEKEFDFVKYNPDKLLKFEEALKKDNFDYLVYKCIFQERKTWQETADELLTDTNRLTPIVDKLAFAIYIIRNT